MPAVPAMYFHSNCRWVSSMSGSVLRNGFSPGQKGLSERIYMKRKRPKDSACEANRNCLSVLYPRFLFPIRVYQLYKGSFLLYFQMQLSHGSRFRVLPRLLEPENSDAEVSDYARTILCVM